MKNTDKKNAIDVTEETFSAPINAVVETYLYTTTNHIETFEGQEKKLVEEWEEYNKAIAECLKNPTIENQKHVVSELNDYITALIKYNSMTCESLGINLTDEIKENYQKNDDRNYYD